MSATRFLSQFVCERQPDHGLQGHLGLKKMRLTREMGWQRKGRCKGKPRKQKKRHIPINVIYCFKSETSSLNVFLPLSDAVTLNMAELGAATVNRILYEKSCSKEELLNSRNNEEIVNYLKYSNRPREDFQVLQNLTSPKIGLKW